MSNSKRFVYILRSINNPAAYYVGLTSDLEARLAAHNAGLSSYTAANRPRIRLVAVEFDEGDRSPVREISEDRLWTRVRTQALPSKMLRLTSNP